MRSFKTNVHASKYIPKSFKLICNQDLIRIEGSKG